MKKRTLIINKRNEMPFAKKIGWDIVTVLLWAGWIYLWKPLLIVFYKIVTLDAEVDEISNVIFDEISAVTVEHAIIMLVATPTILFILSWLNRHVAPSVHFIYKFDEYAKYFQVDSAKLRESVDAQLITINHDNSGRIVDIETKI
ncbi:MAG TPA: poly-beta-1,6-N-acetyl-D-glucosamine biosynthesis protein PgaD [Sulfurimonas sp.]|uniref:poly-beta-1,6-N-acetyl-D-glucosamine biosynthesis protein PgaD n=1 Tax=Sulfurimonas sp. TaxID=2022749 RepID=UPI002C1A5C41|nr:poly-beta-1,6-N-acetyl-D-glucosamine biosynthesis protein PgaD [Sulfurimonas sp.]HUH42436.1 poly-beta-1,6-N-acetyl-D-glucosamine biosynthesis protein PgaD [Sulfurimonas sp.]